MQRGTCKHFSGAFLNKTCPAGVNYRQATGGPDMGWLCRIPCRKEPEIRGGKP